MGWFDSDSDEYQLNDQYHNQASLTHETLSGAAAFYAAKKYEDHVAANGQPPTHALAKELIAGATGAFIDREVETKGLDYIDSERAKSEAKKRAEQGLVDSGDYAGDSSNNYSNDY